MASDLHFLTAKNPASLALVAALALLPACSGEGRPTSTGDTPTTDAPSTGTTTTTGTTPATTGDSPTTTSGDGVSATASSTSGLATTTGTTTTLSTTSVTTDTTTSTTTTSTTGDPGACQDLAGVDFGDCKAIIGTGLVDGKCVAISGCDCGSHCDAFFADPLECATTCAAEGVCNEGLIEGRGLLKGPCTMDTQFDDTQICGGDQAAIAQLVPADCKQPVGFPCDGASMCILPWGEFTDDQWRSVCAVSLLPGVELVACTLYGP